MTWNPPPNWPKPPTADWTPEPGWQPDPAWGPAPAGWNFTGAPTAAMPAAASTAAFSPILATVPAESPLQSSGAAWYRKHWVQLVAVGLIALGTGAVIGDSNGAASDKKALAAEQRAKTAEATATSATAERDAAKSEAADATSKADAAAQASVASKQAELDARKTALDAREQKISGAEAVAKSNTFDGADGKYLVGSDIRPGTYRGTASAGCYYARLSSVDSSDILENNNTDGPVVIRILASDKAFQVTRCGTFTRIGS